MSVSVLAFVITHVDSLSPHCAALKTHTHTHIPQNFRVNLCTPGQAEALFFIQSGS